MFILLFISFYINFYFSTISDVYPNTHPIMKIHKHYENTSINRKQLLVLNPRVICSKYVLNIPMLSKFIIISASLFYILIYCLSKTINSVRFIPYNFSLNRSVKTLKNSQSISRNSFFYIILLNVYSVESFIMTLYFLSDIYYVNLPTIATSKMIFLVSINSHNLGNRVILIAYSSNLVSQFFYFWLSATAARAISYWTFF